MPSVSMANSLKVDFLVFTRFKDDSLDYKFYFASQNEILTETIREELIPQESYSDLPYEAFFVYKNYCVLTIAETWADANNQVRKDHVGRDILRRIFFVWDFFNLPSWLKYEHLLYFLWALRKITKENVDIVPNENKDGAPKQLSFEIKRSDVENFWDEESKVYKVDYGKFLESKQKDIQLQMVNITTPADWTFDKQILLLRGFSISDTRYSIWHKVAGKISPKFEKLLSGNNRWVALDEKGDYISLHRPDRIGSVEKIEAKEENIKSGEFDAGQKETKPDEVEVKKENTKTDVAEEVKTEEIALDDEETTKEKIIHPFELCDLEITHNVDFLKKEISFFICSDSKFKSSILDSWNNVLNEIRVHYANASKAEKQEWIRRLDNVRAILEEEINITHNDMFAYQTSFSLLTKRLYELMEDDRT